MEGPVQSPSIDCGAIPSPSCPRRPARWRLQVSLRAAIGMLTLLCVALGWLAMKADHARRQERAVESMPFFKVRYDYHESAAPGTESRAIPPGPAFIRSAFGEHVFADVVHLAGRHYPAPPPFDPQAFANVAKLRR